MAAMTRAERAEALRQAYRDGYTDRMCDMAGYLRVSDTQARRLLAAGYVKSVKVGSRRLIHHRSLVEYASAGAA